ncbi:hypothetical protein BJ165DRAFT_1429652 [Panaeolus papilionaceus]|nr:hypothetical protein BJ165DRAFT_1429652 [Panaeolus papilionaceus]
MLTSSCVHVHPLAVLPSCLAFTAFHILTVFGTPSMAIFPYSLALCMQSRTQVPHHHDNILTFNVRCVSFVAALQTLTLHERQCLMTTRNLL